MAAEAESTSSRRSLLSVIASAYMLSSAGRAADVLWLLLLFTVLAVEQVAVFALASAIAAFFAMALDAGLNQTLLREFSSRRLSLTRGIKIAFSVRAALLIAAVLAGAIWLLIAQPAHDVVSTVAVACSVQLWIVIEQFCQQWLKANDRQTLANALAASEPFLKLAAAGVLVLGQETVTAREFFAAQNIYHGFLTVACVMACLRAARRIPSATSAPVASPLPVMLRASAWFALMGLITVAQNRVDWLLVANFTDDTETASYSLVNRAYEVLVMLIGTGALTLFPRLCRNKEQSQAGDGVGLYRKVVLAMGVLAAGVAACALPEFCNVVWHGKYPGADFLFATLLPVACLSTFIQLMYYEAIASRAEARLVVLGIVSTLTQLAINVALVPMWGASGAVVGMVALAGTNIALYFFQRQSLGLPPASAMMRLAAYAAVMSAAWAGIALSVPGLWLQLALGLLVWGALSQGWLLDGSERRAFRAAWQAFRLRQAATDVSAP